MILTLFWVMLRLMILLPLWLFGLIFLLLGLGLSPWGTGMLLEEGAKRGFYTLESYEGSPLDHLVLRDLSLDAGPANIAAERLEIAWAEDCLLSGRLCLDTFEVEGARIRVSATEPAPAEESEPGEPASPIALPFPVEIRSLALRDVEVRLADGTRLAWDHFSTGAVAEDDTVTLAPTRLSDTRLMLPGSPGWQLALDDNTPQAERSQPRITAAAIDAAIAAGSSPPAVASADGQEPDGPPLEEQPRRELPDIRLPLRIEAPELLVEDFVVGGPMDYAVERLAVSLTAEEHEVDISSLEVTTEDADARLEANVTLRDDYPLQARLKAALWLPERMPELAGQRINLALDGNLGDLIVRLGFSGPITATFDARLDALDPTVPFTASLDSKLVQWPLPSAAALADPEQLGDTPLDPTDPWLVEDITLRLDGSLTGYRVAASLMAEGPDLPYSRLALAGTGDLEHFAWTPLSFSLGQASVVSRGRVDWAEGLDVEAITRLDNLDPEAFVEGLPGRLDGDAELNFTQSVAGWSVEVPRLAIDGELQQRPLSLAASLTGNSEMQWQIDTLDFRQGENRLTARGQVSETSIDVAGQLDLPALASLYDDLGGSLSGEFSGSGTLEAPQLDLEMSGQGLRFAENRLERLRLAGRVSGLEDPALDIELGIERLDAAGQRFDAIDLGLDGRLSEHRLTLDANAGQGMPLSRAALAIEGGLGESRERYAGRLTPLEVDTLYGDIRLAEALAFEINLPAGSAQVAPFCLERVQGGALCLQEPLDASAESGRAQLALQALPMSLLDEVVPAEWELDGATNAELIAEWGAGGTWRAQLDLDSELAMNGVDAYGQPWALPESSVTLTADANQTRADMDLGLSLAEVGDINLELGIDDPTGEAQLDGRLRLSSLQLAPYRTLVAGMDRMEGTLGGNVRIGGNRAAPTLDGRIGLDQLRLEGGDLPLAVADGELEVQLAGDRADIDGFIAAEQGRLLIDGSAGWPDPENWRVAVDLEAREDPLLATLPAFGRLRIAPDLTIRVVPDRLQVRGTVQVPWARLEVGDIPESAVAPSPDEVIITRRDQRRMDLEAQRAAERAAAQEMQQNGESAAATLTEAGMAMDVRIELQLGPDMLLDAYGLESGLSGNLEVRQQNGPVQLFGDVSLVDGRFRAFGQDLLIREGQLLFSGPPDQPLLDFEAIRNPEVTEDGVIAGLRVTGSTAQPQLEIFSEPSMEEAQALSYLLRGRSADDSGGADGALTSALVGMTLGRTGGAVGAIGQAFGVDDLNLETAGAGDESQVVLSGQLTEDLRLSYGVGLFSPIAELTLRYTVWRNLYLEAVSGAAQAVDLVYAFSRPGAPPDP
ncbi:translocation/assembly module TamB [Halomonas sp. TRM85114]|uniref:autotransporter assembly complex protein TamB n=1 Tax=Halomonas jincaotanensis TaxID=2810616 RepID=UPI001BD5FBEF|nr:translocation/assembly module TamB domain-containing protein [Halomonas jincaotanensis]MBS9402587.1 translocation/assembly module TamB [Halomonas jincaotanensis]